MLKSTREARELGEVGWLCPHFSSIIVCSFIYAISYPLPHGGRLQTEHLQRSDDREEQDKIEKTANERSLTVATWALVLATTFLFFAAAVQAGLFVWQLDLIRRSLADTKKAADAAEKSANAARLNADALMVAEAAQMYVIVESHNLVTCICSAAATINLQR
jgi:hypothetical protein